MEEKNPNPNSKCLVVFKNKCLNEEESMKSEDGLTKRNILKRSLPVEKLNNTDLNLFSNEDSRRIMKKITKKVMLYLQNVGYTSFKSLWVTAAIGGKWAGSGGWIVGGVLQLYAVTILPICGLCWGFWVSVLGIPKSETDEFLNYNIKHFGTEGIQMPNRGVVGGLV